MNARESNVDESLFTALLEPPGELQIAVPETERPERVETALPSAPSYPPKPKDARYQMLDAWRGIACLMLLLYHGAFYAEHSWRSGDSSTWTISGLAINLIGRLWVGVPLFFVVSGYCIAASIDSLRRKPHSLGQYMLRRVRRIYPPLWAAYALAIGLTLGIAAWSTSLFENSTQLPRLASFTTSQWIGNFTASESWLSNLRGGEPNYLMLNTWTLCYEEQFYLATGALLFLAARRFFTGVAVIAVLTLVARHVARVFGVSLEGFFFDGHWLLFAAGILVYQCINYGKTRSAKLATVGLLLTGVLYGAYERLRAPDHFDKHLGEYLVAACLFAGLLIFLKRWDLKIAGQALLRPFTWCGKISYSIYLTHFPVVVALACGLKMMGLTSDEDHLLIGIPLCLMISLPIGYLFHIAVERRFMNASS